jgi:hypothetical protein
MARGCKTLSAQGCEMGRWRDWGGLGKGATSRLQGSTTTRTTGRGSGPVRSEPGSPLLGPSRTPDRTSGPVQALCRTLNRTSVRFGKVQVRTEVQNRTPATLASVSHRYFNGPSRGV